MTTVRPALHAIAACLAASIASAQPRPGTTLRPSRTTEDQRVVRDGGGSERGDPRRSRCAKRYAHSRRPTGFRQFVVASVSGRRLKGAWAWLDFHNEPWEGNGSAYFGAALAAIAVGTAPGEYSASPDIQDRLTLLRGYLQRGADSVSLFNRMMALWASGGIQNILTKEQRQSIVDAAFAKQQSDAVLALTQP